MGKGVSYRETIARVRLELEQSGVVVKPTVNERIVFAYYMGTPAECVNVEYTIAASARAFSGQIAVGRRNGRMRRTLFRQKDTGDFNWPGIVRRVKEVLDSIRARKHAEAQAAIESAAADTLVARVLAELEAVEYADARVYVMDDRIYITFACDNSEAVYVAAQLAGILKHTDIGPKI